MANCPKTPQSKTLLIANLSERIEYRALYVHDFGDNCTNGIRDDAKATNSMSPLKGARFAASAKANALRDLSCRFPRVVFRGVSGNHGRFTKGMPWKQPTEILDRLVFEWTKASLASLQPIRQSKRELADLFHRPVPHPAA
jgi:hypothetical protein